MVTLEELLQNAWDAGFDHSGEGYNAEYLPPGAEKSVVEARNAWVKNELEARGLVNKLTERYDW